MAINMLFRRSLQLPPSGTKSFFLWGPRLTGKSTLLKQCYPDAKWIDLLLADQLRHYATRPESLRHELQTQNFLNDYQVVIDEIQKVPQLLDEVHWMIENMQVKFALCGSSARNVRRSAANMLGGRALRYELHGITSQELGDEFDLNKILNRGYMPSIYTSEVSTEMLNAYIDNYLKEEIINEGLVRNLPLFSNFLEVAGLADGEIVNFANIASECGIPLNVVKANFQILEDTLLGNWLPAWRKRVKRRVVLRPKFYFSDVGVVNQLAKRGNLQPGSELFGKAFENWVFHELTAFSAYTSYQGNLTYWKLPSGIEVDFVLGDMELAVEVKASKYVTNRHLRGLRSIFVEYPNAKNRVIVCLENIPRRTDDGIDILPAREFAKRLWNRSLV